MVLYQNSIVRAVVNKMSLLEQVTQVVQPALRQCGVTLYDLQWSAASGGGILRIFIDKPEGVNLDDCERVSLAIGTVLDAYEVIPGRYRLEVSSPGAERPLRHRQEWDASVGMRVHMRCRSGVSEAILEGTLQSVDDAGVQLDIKEKRDQTRVAISWENIVAGRRAVEI